MQSQVSGAGRSATARTHFVSANENLEAYGVASHRHTPEIEQILGIEGRLVFTPHLAPTTPWPPFHGNHSVNPGGSAKRNC